MSTDHCLGTINGAKLCLSAFQGQLEPHRTLRMTGCFTNRLPFKTQGKTCVCGTPVSVRITAPLPNCCSHNPPPLQSSKRKHEVHVDVCAVAVSCGGCCCRVPGQCCCSLVCFMVALYPLSYVHCNVFIMNVSLLITPILCFFIH